MTPAGRRIRLAVTVLGAVLLLAGSVWGSDDDFPFGPFRMYAGVNGPNEDAPDPFLAGAFLNGAAVVLDESTTGIRRAEVESRVEAYRAEPALLAGVASAYGSRHPGDPPVVSVSLVVRWHVIRSSRPTGAYRDEVVASWRA